MATNQTELNLKEKSVLQRELLKCANFLSCYLPLANAHPVDFITEDVWNRVLPENIQNQLCALTEQELTQLPSCYSISADRGPPLSTDKAGSNVRANEECLPSDISAMKTVSECKSIISEDSTTSTVKHQRWVHKSLKELVNAVHKHCIENLECVNDAMQNLSTWLQDRDEARSESTLFVHSFMNQKKMHEVEIMADLCTRIFKRSSADMVIDLGSGKGYLSTHLSLQFHLPVIGLDSQPHNTSGAVQRAEKLRQKWDTLMKCEEKKSLQKTDGANTPQQHTNNDGLQSQSESFKMSTGHRDNVKDDPSQHDKSFDCVDGISDNSSKPSNHFQTSEMHATVSISKSDQMPNIHEENQSSKSKPTEHTAKTPLDNHVSVPEKTENHSNGSENQFSSSVSSGRNVAVSVTAFVSLETKLTDLVLDSGNNLYADKQADELRLLLVGLHTCGPLASSMLQLFVKDDSVKAMCGVGCCYQLMQERFTDESGCWQDPDSPHSSKSFDQKKGDFPLSSILLKHSFSIGRTALNMASLALPRMAQTSGTMQGKTFYPRALLQAFILKKLGHIPQDMKKLRKLARQSSGPVDYVVKALRKLNIAGCEATEDEVTAFHEEQHDQEHKMAAFFQLRAILAPVVETVVLLDRLLYLMEQDCMDNAFLVPLFDPVTSPRCHAIIAFKKESK